MEDHTEEVDVGVLDRLLGENVVALELHTFDIFERTDDNLG